MCGIKQDSTRFSLSAHIARSTNYDKCVETEPTKREYLERKIKDIRYVQHISSLTKDKVLKTVLCK